MEIKKEIKNDAFAVKITLEEENKVLGWTFVYIMFQDRHPEPYAYLENVYIEEEYRSRGLGTQLLELAIAEAKEQGCYKIIGTCKMKKVLVHEFYEKHGFKKMGFEFRMDLKETEILTKD
ncbi:MAG: GCN5-related N-acetyltransferase [Candidatus Magasanikbacteria bacterium GW2011_GWC2_37_14]|uniref:GCN5-related N-acetyltransferase n=1 Tax=Candidatus Magasanikbacteria bacterium GW2011_GWC2_37_14 TaxID=1619046 RepID=A0A0G0GCT5_9BACT|nr:MAG: GCN5-related N-acetyltransferase [Candidatus Magasanikbacteria bacterium GW2011_GWC2_37_14]